MNDEAVCGQCGTVHARSAMELSFKRPDAIVALSADQRKNEAKESDDLCAIKPDRFFIRGVLPLRVSGWDKPYNIGLWVEVARATFERVLKLWEAPDQDGEPPFAAMIANEIPSFPPTIGLAVKLQLTGPASRPNILVPESEHPLHREQCLGINAHRANEYSSYF